MLGLPVIVRNQEFNPVFRFCMIESEVRTWRSILKVFTMGIPLLLIAILCYGKIFHTVRESKKKLAQHQLHPIGKTENVASPTGYHAIPTSGCQASDVNRCQPHPEHENKRRTSSSSSIESSLAESVDSHNSESASIADKSKGEHIKSCDRENGSKHQKKCFVPSDSKINKIKIEFYAFTLFFFFTLPYSIARINDDMEEHLVPFQMFLFLLVFINNFFNFILYGIMNRQIRAAILTLIRWKTGTFKLAEGQDV